MISNNLITNEEMNSEQSIMNMPESETSIVLNKTQAKRKMTSLSRKIEASKSALDSLCNELSRLRAEFPEPEEKGKGRPKKASAKTSSADSSTEDLFAKMVSDNMNKSSSILDAIVEDPEADVEEEKPKKVKKAPIDAETKALMALEKKQELAKQKEQEKEAKKLALAEQKEQEKAAKAAALEQEKEAKKLALAEQKEQEKAAKIAEKKAALEQEKEAKKLALEQEKAAKIAEKKAALEQEKEAKKLALAQEKAAKLAEKNASKPAKEKKDKKEKKEKVAEVVAEEPAPVKLTVTWAVIDNTKYLKAASGVLYNPETKEAIGVHDEETNTIKPLPEEEDDEEMVEEEYDESSN
jgi:hypothetical protein